MAARLPGLRSMPVFGDEAIKLHWALLFRENPIRFALVSMQGLSLPPLHTWFLGFARPLAEDPVRAGRLLSVCFGVLTVPAFFLLCSELRSRLSPTVVAGRHRDGPGMLVGGLLLVFCPYLAFQQRLAMVEALYVLETTIAVWLAVRLALHPRARTAVGLGAVMAAAMLTRQGLSYVLWALPPIAFFLFEPRRSARIRLFARGFAGSLGVGLLLWLPAILLARDAGLFERLLHTRFLMAPMSAGERLRMAAQNSVTILDWLWTYMTPPVLLAAAGSLAALLWKQWRLGTFLLGWLAVALLPLVFFGNYLFSRYGSAAVIPLLAAIALVFDRLNLRKPIAALVAIAVVLWPARETLLQALDWQQQHLVSVDRWQFFTGWPAGAATEQAVAFLRREADKVGFVLLVPRNDGNPMDTLWLYFARSPSVRAFSAGDVLTEPLLRESLLSGAILLDADPRRMEPARSIAIPPTTPVYYVSTEPILTRQGRVGASKLLARLNPSLEEVARFWNLPEALTERPTDGVVVYRVR